MPVGRSAMGRRNVARPPVGWAARRSPGARRMSPNPHDPTTEATREEGEVLLESKNAVVYGAAGSVGGAVARAFAREGARVFLAGRTEAPLRTVADEIGAEWAVVDALDADADAVDAHADTVGRIDISFNAITHNDVQGAPMAE